MGISICLGCCDKFLQVEEHRRQSHTPHCVVFPELRNVCFTVGSGLGCLHRCLFRRFGSNVAVFFAESMRVDRELAFAVPSIFSLLAFAPLLDEESRC